MTLLIDRIGQPGTVTIAVSEDAARALHIQYGLHAKESGRSVWERPRIFSFRQWVINAWRGLWPDKQLMHPVQELLAYKRVIEQSAAGGALLSPAAAARLARVAGELVVRHRIPTDHVSFGYTPEASNFARWHEQAMHNAAQQGLITFRNTIDDLTQRLAALDVMDFDRMLLVGINEPDQQQRELFDLLRVRGVAVEDVDLSAPCDIGRFIRPRTLQQELDTAVSWVRAQLIPYLDDLARAPSIGIVVPDINAVRSDLERALIDHLTPSYLYSGAIERRVPWRFARGPRLSENEVVSAAVLILQLRQDRNSIDDVTRVLLSRYIAAGEDTLARAHDDLRVRNGGGSTVSLTRLVSHAHAILFASRLDALCKHLEDTNSKALPSEWRVRFEQRLRLLLWAGYQGGSSEHFQVRGAWEDALDVFSSMDGQLGLIVLEQALVWLGEILRGTLYQPRVNYRQPIQIVEMQGCSGLRFDRAIVLGLSAETLPGSVAPNPFIPTELQSSLPIPGASPEMVLSCARVTADQLNRLAAEIVYSCASVDDFGAPVSPSPLFDGWNTRLQSLPCAAGARALFTGTPATLVQPNTDKVPPVDVTELKTIKGGVGILSDFNAVPFAAFARHRLGLRPFPTTTIGLSKQEQGKLVHAALECFWRAQKSSANVAVLSEQSFETAIAESVDEAILKYDVLPTWRYGNTVVQLERARVARLMREWINLELLREEPFTVIATEHLADINVGGLPMRVRVDRIDAVQSGNEPRYLVIDYKTGAHIHAERWRAEKPADPQLPLYCLYVNHKDLHANAADGVAIGHVVRNHMRFMSLTRWTSDLAGDGGKSKSTMTSDWDALLQSWRGAVETSVKEFIGGRAEGDAGALLKSNIYQDLLVLVRE